VAQIATLVGQTIETGLLTVEEDGTLALSEEGLARLAKARFPAAGPIIEPRESARRPQINIHDLYLPSRPPS